MYSFTEAADEKRISGSQPALPSPPSLHSLPDTLAAGASGREWASEHRWSSRLGWGAQRIPRWRPCSKRARQRARHEPTTTRVEVLIRLSALHPLHQLTRR